MNTPAALPAKQQSELRLLVGITSFGDKNLGLLKRVIAAYQSMPLRVDVAVLSNAPKDLGPSVKVVVGMPSEDPWSLPFAHKAYFAANAENYDLFAYTEEDMLVTFENIRAFLAITPALASDEIAGFIRYEIDPAGARSMPDIHAGFHWKADSVRQRGPYVVAEHTCEHAAFYLLTKDQLARAIASGGFVRPPYTDQYDLACTAATDPYLKCGFRRVVCVSEPDGFLIHHASNRYVGQLGISFANFVLELEAIKLIATGSLPATTLCETETRIYNRRWSKSCYENPARPILDLVPLSAKTVLSFGSGCGATETALRDKGAGVTVIPINSVMGHVTERLGFEVLHCTIDDWIQKVGPRRFDCVVVTNLIHLVPDQGALIERLCSVLATGGTLLLSGPNLYALPIFLRRLRNRSHFRDLANFDRSGIHLRTVGAIEGQIKRAGLRLVAKQWFDETAPRKTSALRRNFRSFFSSHWIMQARRQ